MKVDAFRREIDRRGTFHELTARYAQALFGFVANRLRATLSTLLSNDWRLMARDRSKS
jgi:hypothetical protein